MESDGSGFSHESLHDNHSFSNSNSASEHRNPVDILKSVGLDLNASPETSPPVEHMQREPNKRNFSYRLLTFKRSGVVESGLPYKSYDLARNGYYLGIQFLNILCAFCNFNILVDDIKRRPNLLIERHKKCSPRCEGVTNNTLRSPSTNPGIDADPVARSANAVRDISEDSAIISLVAASLPVNKDKAPEVKAATAEVCPSQSENRLPVPVHVKSEGGRLSSETVIVRSSGRTKPETPAYPSVQAREPLPQRTTGRNISEPVELRRVSKPVARNDEFDTFEGRLRTYSEWPKSHPLRPEEMARAGFYYTHQHDKVKCPYCMGAIFNWEPSDTAFGEHSRHYPRCGFLKYAAYQALTSPVPSFVPHPPRDRWEDSKAVEAVLSMGYSFPLVQEALSELRNKNIPLCSESILDIIFGLEKQRNQCLLRLDSAGEDSESAVNSLEGAVGGLNLTELNQDSQMQSLRLTPSSEPDEELYRPTKNDSGNFEIEYQSMESKDMQPISNSGAGASAKTPATAAKEQRGMGSGQVSVDPEMMEVQNEYRRLQKSNICNKCGKKPVNILFLPCRHLVTCEECAEDMDECLECHEEIIGTVKVFLT